MRKIIITILGDPYCLLMLSYLTFVRCEKCLAVNQWLTNSVHKTPLYICKQSLNLILTTCWRSLFLFGFCSIWLCIGILHKIKVNVGKRLFLRWARTRLCGPWQHMSIFGNSYLSVARHASNQFVPSLSPASLYFAPNVTPPSHPLIS